MPGKDVLVCGTLNLETMLPIGSFPLPYEPVHYRRFELSSNPSGVGFNVARALHVLGNRVRFTSMVGPDFLGTSLRRALATFDLSDEFVCWPCAKRPSRSSCLMTLAVAWFTPTLRTWEKRTTRSIASSEPCAVAVSP